MPETEAELVARAVRGDHPALSELIASSSNAVRQELSPSLPRKFQSVLSVDDVLQDAFTTAFLHIDRFEWRGEGSFRAWLTMIAWNSLRDVLRMLEADKRGGDRHRIDPNNWEESYTQLYNAVGASTSTPSRQVARSEAKVAIETALAELPDPYGQVIRLYDIEGQSAQEVAATLRRTVGAFYMVRARAHRKLSELLGAASLYFTKPG